MKSRVFLALIFFLLQTPGFPQSETVEEMVENYAEFTEDENSSVQLAEELVDLTSRPVNLNNAGEDELAGIPFLTEGDQKRLLEYIRTYGEIYSIYELRSIQGFDSALIRKIQPFITILPASEIPPPTLRNLLHFARSACLFRISTTFPRGEGYTAGDSVRQIKPGYYYPGDPQRYYFRFHSTWFDKLKVGFGGEKDPGEQFFTGSQKSGLDYYAGYISLHKAGPLVSLVLGTFRAGFGLGLTFCSGASLNYGAGFSLPSMHSPGISPSLSMNESSYLRGVAATFKVKPLRFSLFSSYHAKDATGVTTDTATGGAGSFSNFSSSGYHRTSSETEHRRAVREFLAGTNVQLTIAPSQEFGFKIGTTFYYCRYSVPLVIGNDLRSAFTFNGSENLVGGIDFLTRFSGNMVFGEVSRSRNGGMAWLAGIGTSPTHRVKALFIIRDYRKNYQNLYGSAFGQFSRNANEQGIFSRIEAALTGKLNVTGFLDLFKAPWLRYRIDFPSKGWDVGILLNYALTRWSSTYLRILRSSDLSNDQSLPLAQLKKVIDIQAMNIRWGMELNPSVQWKLRTRFDLKQVTTGTLAGTCGYAVSQDIHYQSDGRIGSLNFRFTVFDVPSYETRIYIYEPDVLYGFSIPALEGSGIRSAGVCRFRLSRNISIWIKGGITCYTDRSSTGSGIDRTEGNLRADMTGQLMVRF